MWLCGKFNQIYSFVVYSYTTQNSFDFVLNSSRLHPTNSSAMHHSHFMKRWQNHEGRGSRPDSACPAVCGCIKGRGEDRGVTSVVEEGLGTDVCLCEGLRWRSKYVSWSDGKVNMVCDGWDALMWSLTADIMVQQAIHQWILDQRIPPLPSVLHAVEQTCSVLSICSLKTVIRQMLFMMHATLHASWKCI